MITDSMQIHCMECLRLHPNHVRRKTNGCMLQQRIPSELKSHTVVYDAAAFLLRQGLLNVKDTPHVNIKQARALLHFAHWLQQHLSRRWSQEQLVPEVLETKPLHTFFHALIGGPGTGKTTTTKVINALLEHFLGPECMPQSAPTNTAARLLGGNTVDARYKLPRSSLLSNRDGQLSDSVLKAFRRQWKGQKFGEVYSTEVGGRLIEDVKILGYFCFSAVHLGPGVPRGSSPLCSGPFSGPLRLSQNLSRVIPGSSEG